MKVSIFTPTHDPEFLLELYKSIATQTCSDWEWVLQPNGQDVNGHVDIPDDIRKDPKVRILPYTRSDGIGVLKKMCCMAASGDLFAEVDHDDLLAPNCLQRVVETAKDSGAGFIYSDSIHFMPDDKCEVFSKDYGWEHYTHTKDEKQYVVMKSFEAQPRALCEIYWSPNHIRVWTKEAYNKTGGHSGRLMVGDDHDLMCRTYLAGYEFAHIPEPLYWYRRYSGNSFVVHNAEVQRQQYANRDTYLHPLIFEWCKRKKLLMLDLGGAHNCPKNLGFKSVDADMIAEGVDYRCFVPSPEFNRLIEDNSVGCFRASDFFEHVPNVMHPQMFNALYDKLAPGGFIISQTPAVCDNEGKVGKGAFQDPTHTSFWSQNNTWYFTNKNLAKYVPEIRCKFQSVRCEIHYPTEWHKQNLIPYLFWDSCALKGQRQPGQVLI